MDLVGVFCNTQGAEQALITVETSLAVFLTSGFGWTFLFKVLYIKIT